MSFTVSFKVSPVFHLFFFRVIFSVHLGFHVYKGFVSGVLIRVSLRFLWVSPRVFRVSFRIRTGKNKATELGFHLGIL